MCKVVYINKTLVIYFIMFSDFVVEESKSAFITYNVSAKA
jgi:hypothetical protein